MALGGLTMGDQFAVRAAAGAGRNPLKDRSVIFLFMHGGPSQVDTFDYKPKLQQMDGKKLPFAPAKSIFEWTPRLDLAQELGHIPGATLAQITYARWS